MPRKYKTKRKKSRSKPAKAVKLDGEFWLKNAKDLKAYRESMLIEQEHKCAVSLLPINVDNSCADHAHAGNMCPNNVDGKMRGLLISDMNLIEGTFLKKFKRAKIKEKYNIDFPEFLISLGEYLQQDNGDQKYHVNYMNDLRNHIKRLTKAEIASKIRIEFGIEASEKEEKAELVRRYTQCFVDLVEAKEKSKLK